MAEIITEDGEKLTVEERIDILVGIGMPYDEAVFVVAFMDGEISGDLIEDSGDEDDSDDDED